jgi:hypothetical protein
MPYIKVEVTNGMFSSERCIAFRDINDNRISDIVDESVCRNGFLTVSVLSSDDTRALIDWPYCMDPMRAVVPLSVVLENPEELCPVPVSVNYCDMNMSIYDMLGEED